MSSPVQACDATGGMSDNLIGHDFIRVGEAAVAINPLEPLDESGWGAQRLRRTGRDGGRGLQVSRIGFSAPSSLIRLTNSLLTGNYRLGNAANAHVSELSHYPRIV